MFGILIGIMLDLQIKLGRTDTGRLYHVVVCMCPFIWIYDMIFIRILSSLHSLTLLASLRYYMRWVVAAVCYCVFVDFLLKYSTIFPLTISVPMHS